LKLQLKASAFESVVEHAPSGDKSDRGGVAIETVVTFGLIVGDFGLCIDALAALTEIDGPRLCTDPRHLPAGN
jgi:hypothetical protein